MTYCMIHTHMCVMQRAKQRFYIDTNLFFPFLEAVQESNCLALSRVYMGQEQKGR